MYFVRSAVGWMIIDTGIPGKRKKILDFMHKNNIPPCKVKIIVITHAHYDHVGNLANLKFLTSAPVFIHHTGAALIESANSVLPTPVSPMAKLSTNLVRIFPFALRFKPVKADETVHNKTSLSAYGFQANIIPTPGHTEDSVSVVFDDGTTFTGDACFNMNFKRNVIPPFINDAETLLKSWHLLNENGVKKFYPGHGMAFGIDKFHRSFKKLEKLSKKP